MAETIANNIPIDVNPTPVRKERTKKRKALKPKTPSGNEANILAGNISQTLSGIGKENNETFISAKKTTKRNSKSKELEKSFEKELQELKQKDPLKPKRPISAFFLFSKDLREVFSAENKNMLEKQKEEYLLEIELYKTKQDNEAVIHQLEEEQHLKIQKQEALQLLRKKKKEKAENISKKTKETHQKKMKQKEEKNTDPNKPKKLTSSFFLFRKETRMNL
ncbi:hypothetical protein GIB67_016397 [Kingdonia uniflora]|uniref:HMG box domain-containing protein n=1 Tax=Kingdonia uniflora TaxID=39325 RepID=A0A7J7MGU7_9MAGN|nr:hypothetical protein GIB67_016397 [Kingdonia uniflora]